MEEIIGRPETCWIDYTKDDTDFQNAMDAYKLANNRPFPTLREVLAVVRSMGYRKVAESVDLPRYRKGSGITGMKGRHDAGRELDKVPRASDPSKRSAGKSQREFQGDISIIFEDNR